MTACNQIGGKLRCDGTHACGRGVSMRRWIAVSSKRGGLCPMLKHVG